MTYLDPTSVHEATPRGYPPAAWGDIVNDDLNAIWAAYAKSTLHGDGPPANTLGRDGGYYVDRAGSVVYGPKTAGVWPAGTQLVGPVGAVGPVGPASAVPGPVGPAGPAGPMGPSSTVTGPTGPAGHGSTVVGPSGTAAGAAGATGGSLGFVYSADPPDPTASPAYYDLTRKQVRYWDGAAWLQWPPERQVWGGQYVAVDDLGNFCTSPNASDWTARGVLPISAEGSSRLLYAAGLYVVLARSGQIATSADGITWTAIATTGGLSLGDLAYGAGRWVALGERTVMTSADGVVWSETSTPLPSFVKVAYGNGKFLAVAGGRAVTSTDGLAWSAPVPCSISFLAMLTYANGRFEGINQQTGSVVSSVDGVTWDTATLHSGSWQGLTYGNGRFLTVEYSSGAVATSLDGLSWTYPTTLGSGSFYRAVCYSHGAFVIASDASALSSIDGATWIAGAWPTSFPSPQSNNFFLV